MKHYLIDPKLNWYKANLHCHTTDSDGHLTPKEVKDLYKEQGYSVIAFSDHEVMLDHSELTDNEFVALTACEYSITKNDGKTDWLDMTTIHMNMFSPNPHINLDKQGMTDLLQAKDKRLFENAIVDHLGRVYSKENVQNTIDLANKNGFLVQFNHPNWSLNTNDEFMDLKGLWALEIFNYLTELETGTEYCPNLYDDMLRHGHRIHCSYGDDNHNYLRGAFGSFGGITYIGAEKLTYDNIFNALKNGVFYCSMGPIIKSLVYDDERKEVTIECSPVKGIYLVGSGRRFQSINKEGLTSYSFKLNLGETYFRISIIDKEGKRADTSAYFL